MPTAAQSRRTRRIAVVLTAILALLVGSLFDTSAASAWAGRQGRSSAEHHAWHHHGSYLALGDSVPFGYRPPAVTPPTDYLDADNFVGYPNLVAHRLHLRLTDAACPGETTASMITEGAQSNGCENSVGSPVGYRTAYPLHTDYQGTQLGFAVRYLRQHRHTRLVTVMIGTNDLFVCQQVTADACTGPDFSATVGQVEHNLGTILQALRDAGHYRHRLVVVSYYSPDYGDAATTGSVQVLNAALARAAAAHRAVVADGFGAFQAASEPFGGDACAAGLLVELPTGGCNVHPSAAGHRLLARAVVRVARPSPRRGVR
jgi:lysophospholipase L1-like esterase